MDHGLQFKVDCEFRPSIIKLLTLFIVLQYYNKAMVGRVNGQIADRAKI